MSAHGQLGAGDLILVHTDRMVLYATPGHARSQLYYAPDWELKQQLCLVISAESRHGVIFEICAMDPKRSVLFYFDANSHDFDSLKPSLSRGDKDK